MALARRASLPANAPTVGLFQELTAEGIEWMRGPPDSGVPPIVEGVPRTRVLMDLDVPTGSPHEGDVNYGSEARGNAPT